MGGVVLNDRVNGSLSVSRALGDRLLKAPHLHSNAVSCVPHITIVRLVAEQDPLLLLACDGLWDAVGEQEAVNLVMEGWLQLNLREPVHPSTATQLMARLLTEEALARGSTDNVTVQVLLL